MDQKPDEATDLWGEPVVAPREPTTTQPMTELEHWQHQREQAREREHRRWASGNPMLAKVGAGPDDATCASCVHLLRLSYHDKTYIKCKLRGVTHGPGTDHRVRWPACAKYEHK